MCHERARLTSQDDGTRVLYGGQTRFQFRRKAVPELLGKIPSAEVGGVIAESILILVVGRTW
jgi:hypothetical protein